MGRVRVTKLESLHGLISSQQRRGHGIFRPPIPKPQDPKRLQLHLSSKSWATEVHHWKWIFIAQLSPIRARPTLVLDGGWCTTHLASTPHRACSFRPICDSYYDALYYLCQEVLYMYLSDSFCIHPAVWNMRPESPPNSSCLY